MAQYYVDPAINANSGTGTIGDHAESAMVWHSLHSGITSKE